MSNPLCKSLCCYFFEQVLGSNFLGKINSPPLHWKELHPLPTLLVEVGEVLGENPADVVPHDVGVADDGGVVDDLADAVDHEHDVGDVGEAV